MADLATLKYELSLLQQKPRTAQVITAIYYKQKEISAEEAKLKIPPSIKIDLPQGASTSSKQTTSNELLTDLKETSTGNSTAQKQDVGNASLASINSKVLTNEELREAPLEISGTITVNPAGLATSAIQTDGTQKTQIVDAGGESATITGGKLDVNATISAVGLATEDKQDDEINLLTSIAGEDFSTETTLAAVLAKLSADPATQTTLAAILAKIIAAPSTEAKQDAANALLTTIAAITQPLTDTQLRTTPVPISGTVSVSGLPAGLATSANQTTEISGIAALLSELQLKADLTDTQPVSVASLPLSSGAATSVNQDAQTSLLTTIDGDTGNISTKIDTIAGAVSGTEMQVDVLTMPTVTVSATNLDIRDLTFAADKVDASGTVLGAGTNGIGKLTSNAGVTIGAVEIAAAQTLATVTTVGTVTTITNTVPTKELRSTTPSQSSPSVTNANTSILASNSSRLGGTIYNEGAAICYMKLGATATTTSYSLQMASGGYYEIPFNYTGAIDGITSSGTAQLRVTEIT